MKKLVLLFIVFCFAVSAVAAEKPFSFVQLSDVHIGWQYAINKTTLGTPECMDNTKLTKAVEMINIMQPDFVYFAGDMVCFALEQILIDRFKETIEPLKMPVCYSAGNHDIVLDSRIKIYHDNFGRDYGRFVFNNSLFINIDTVACERYRSRPDYEALQYRYLKNSLEGSKNAGYNHKFVMCHIPFFINDPFEDDNWDNVPKDLRGKYLDLFEKYKVDYVLSGHTHIEFDNTYSGTRHLISTTMMSPAGKDSVGFRLFRVYPNKVETEWIALSDNVSKIQL